MCKKMERDSLTTYLDEIGQQSLLSPEEERQLAEKIAAGDKRAQEKLVTANLKYVVSVARQYQGQGLNIDDLVAEGNVGMIKAAAKFTPQSSKRFVAFANPYIRKAMERAIDQQTSLYKIPKDADTLLERKIGRPLSTDEQLGSKSGVTLMSVLADPDAHHPDDTLIDKNGLEAISRRLDVLDERQRQVMACYYGIDTDHLTMSEIADRMGLKRERVRQIRDKALRKLRKK